MAEYIDRKGLLDALYAEDAITISGVSIINRFPTADVVARPHNVTNLCDSCKHSYPECPSKADDVIFGDGKGNDNIIACAVYEAGRKHGKWMPKTFDDGYWEYDMFVCDQCGAPSARERNYCYDCGSYMEIGD